MAANGGIVLKVAGIGAVVRDPVVRTLMGCSGSVVLAAGAINVGELVLAQQDLAAGQAGFALLVSSYGCGLIGGSLIGARDDGDAGLRRRYLGGIALMVAGLAGFLLPGAFKPLAPSVPFLLGIIMFCMGLTLTPPDFASVAKRPWAVALGIVAHYVIMPGAGWLIAVGLHLEPELAVGLILVGCAPSGTATR